MGSSLLSFVCCFVSCLVWQNKSTTQALSVGTVVILANTDVIQTPKCNMRSRGDVREDETLHYSGDNNTFFLCIQVVASVGLQLGSKTDFFFCRTNGKSMFKFHQPLNRLLLFLFCGRWVKKIYLPHAYFFFFFFSKIFCGIDTFY